MSHIPPSPTFTFMESLIMKLRNRSRSHSPVDSSLRAVPGKPSAENPSEYTFDGQPTATLQRRKSGLRCGKGACLLLFFIFALASVDYCLRAFSVESEEDLPADSPVDFRHFPGLGRNNKDEFYAEALRKQPRFFAVVSLDKEIYRAGEEVLVRVNVFGTQDFRPMKIPSDKQRWYPGLVAKLKMPSGVEQHGASLQMNYSTGAAYYYGHIALESSFAGGEYEVVVEGNNMPFPIAPTTRKFQVRVTSKVNPKLSMQLQFEKKAYAFGDTVVAYLKDVKQLSTGKPPKSATVEVSATVGHVSVFNEDALKLSSDGTCRVEFVLPKPDTYQAGQSGLLSFKVVAGDAIQTISKTLPLVLDTLKIQIYPEAGDLVASKDHAVYNRIYVVVENPRTGEPADMEGYIVEKGGYGLSKKVAKVSTSHEGRGKSDPFKVHSSRSYVLVVSKPSIEHKEYPLPPVSQLPKAGTISLAKSFFSSGEPIQFTVDGDRGAWKVVLSKDEHVLDKKGVMLSGSPKEMTLHAVADGMGDGVLRLTLFADPEGETLPVAERLLFRQPDFFINVTVTAKQGMHVLPRQRVELEVKTTAVYIGKEKHVYKKEKPMESIVGLRVTDMSKLDQVERRKRAPTMNVAKYLERHVLELNDAQVYLDHPEEMDLLLATQGWRRFAYKNVSSFVERKGDEKSMTAKKLAMLGVAHKFQPSFGIRGRPQMMRMQAMFVQEKGGLLTNAAVKRAAPRPNDMEMAEADEAATELVAVVDKNAAIAADVVEEFAANDNRDIVAAKRTYYKPRQYRRVYAYQADNRGKNSRRRKDFGETIYWNPGIKTQCSAGGGECIAKVSFDTNDLLGTFSIDADAFAEHHSGSGHAEIISAKPVSVDVDLPSQLIVGDELLLPVLLSLNSPNAQSFRVDLRLVESGALTFAAPDSSKWKSKTSSGLEITRASPYFLSVLVSNSDVSSTRIYVPVKAVQPQNISAPVLMEATATPLGQWLRVDATKSRDDVLRSSSVTNRGFPVNGGSGGILTPKTQGKGNFSLDLPKDVSAGSSVKMNVAVHLSPYGHLLDVIHSLLRVPCGCFEQTSATTYPMVIALRYLVSLRQAQQSGSPDAQVASMISRAQELLRKGYNRLVSFETPSGGFSWFGDAPGHEALTAYGLMQYTQMSRRELGLSGLVNPGMVARTREWLLKRRAGDGNFSLSSRAIDSFGRAPQDTTNAYILWSLAKAGVVPWSAVEKELRLLEKSAEAGKDPYVIALASSILFDYEAYGKISQAKSLAKQLYAFQDAKTGCVKESLTFETITSSRGQSKAIEATSLAILAWVRFAKKEPSSDQAPLEAAVRCVSESSKAGVYSSTQSTALALEAIVEYMGLVRATAPNEGSVRIKLNGETVKEVGMKQAKLEPTFNYTVIVPALANANVKVEVEMVTEGDFKVPFTISSEFYADTPASSKCQVALSTKLTKPSVKEGDVVAMNVTVRNTNATSSLPMTIAMVGLPAGVEVRMEKLSELKKTHVFDFFEVFPSYVTFYWLGLHAKQSVSFPMELLAKIPGSFVSPASRAYLYYNNEEKVFIEGERLEIKPQNSKHVLK